MNLNKLLLSVIARQQSERSRSNPALRLLRRPIGLLAMTSVSLFLLQTSFAFPNDAKIKIVTTTSTLASIAKDIAGGKAEIYSIASPKRNIHFVSPTPKDVVKLKKSDVFIHAGLDLEAWRNPLLDAVGRLDLMATGDHAIDVSKGVSLLEIPTSLSRAQGDIHAFGNPHYWLDPLNGKIIARNIAEGLARIFPGDADSSLLLLIGRKQRYLELK